MAQNIDNILAQIAELLKKNPRIYKGVLFWSRALGTARNGSDIDIALFGDITYRDIVDISIEYDDLYLPYHVDFVVYDTIKNQDLKNHIDRVGKVLT
jgi:predicted nucleotidyltransferase